MKNVSSISMLSLFILAIISTNVEAKVFHFKSKATGQVMSVHCFFPDSIQCQEKKNEVIRRLKENTNPDQKTLREARAFDLGKNVKNETVGIAIQAKGKVSKMANTVKDEAIELGSNIKIGAQNISDKAKDAVVNTGQGIGQKIGDFVSEEKHKYCKRKLERHAKDFDQQYEATETQLVSFQEKLNYIEKSLVEEGKFETCQDHFEQAVLGYQLKWVQRGEVAQEKTHIFDGLGRLADGEVGYWKNEDRSGYKARANAM